MKPRVGEVWVMDDGAVLLVVGEPERVARGVAHPAALLSSRGEGSALFEWDYAGLEEGGERIA